MPPSISLRLDRAVLIALVLASLLAASAFWQTLRPPLQDLPQHLAAARVLLDPDHPGFRFRELFEIDWLRSQYLGTYVLLGAFFHPLRLVTHEPLLWASRCLLTLLALCWPLATELVYRKLVRRSGLGAVALVLFFNVHLILGFLNFLLGIVACFGALACLAEARHRRRTGEPRAWPLVGWGTAAVACFYLHVVPFALLLGVVGLSLLWEALFPSLRAALQRAPKHGRARPDVASYAVFAPAALALMGWLSTPAGLSTREAAQGSGARGRAVYATFAQNRDALGSWLVDSFTSPWDTRLAGVALGAFALGLVVEVARAAWTRRRAAVSGQPPPGPSASAPGVRCAPDPFLLWSLRAFVPLCVALYFALPSSYDWIWPINARFPILGLLFAPLWLPVAGRAPEARWRVVHAALVALLLAVGGARAIVAREAVTGFAREMRGLDELLASIPPGARVATLVFERGSRHVGFAPFLHVGAYYQAERGGVSFFSFADFPQSPVRFRPEQRPPRARPRWEWTPERVRPDGELSWFDFVITRGGPGRLGSAKTFEPAGQFGRFHLFRRRASAAPP